MNKKILENTAKALPAFFKNAVDYLKSNFDDHGKKIFDNAGGTAGVLIGLFGQPLIDSYFNSLSKKKLNNYGLNTYLKSAIIQADDSLETIKEKLDNSYSVDYVFEILQESITNEIEEFDKSDIILIHQPIYHPAIVYVKNQYQKILRKLNVNPVDIKNFVKHFNDNIEAVVLKEFGEDYERHIKEIESFRLKDNEANILMGYNTVW